MNKHTFTPAEIISLRRNRHVLRASERSITYRPDFKLEAVKRYREGLPPSAIFQEAGFDLALIGRKTPKWRLARWLRIFNTRGAAGLAKENRGRSSHGGGRQPNLENMSEKDKLKYLEAQVVYLKAENAFLAKLRKQRLNYGPAKSSGSSDR